MDTLATKPREVLAKAPTAPEQGSCFAYQAGVAHLLADFERVLSRGETGLLTLVGSAGMGKSLLLQEFARAGRRAGWQVVSVSPSEGLVLDHAEPTLYLVDNVVRSHDVQLASAFSAFKEQEDTRRPALVVLATRTYEAAQMPLVSQACAENGQVLTLEPLTRPQVETEVRQALAEKKYCQDVFDVLVRETAGHPLMVRLMLEQLLTCSQLTAEQAKAVVEDARGKMSKLVWKPLIDGLSDGDLAFLEAMALDDEPSRMQHISNRLGKTPQYAGVYRNRLVAAEIIRSASYGKVTFVTPLLRHYIRQIIAQRMEHQF